MKAAVLYNKNDLRVEDIVTPVLAPNEILVKVKASGICGSDLPRVMGDAAHYYPIVLGHEFSGVVERIGDEVTMVRIGDRVVGAPLKPCHTCRDCQNGDFALCKNYSFVGSRANGGWAEYVVIPEENAIAFDESVSFEEAALVEPSTVALHALRLLGYQGGEHVAIFGGGTIGLLVLQWANILGARDVTVFDIDEERLDIARKFGADYAINSSKPGFEAEWRRITGDRGYGVVLEAAGSDIAMKHSFELVANKGKVCFIGTPAQDLTFNYKQFELLNRKEFSLQGSWMSYSAPFPGDEWGLTLQFLKQGRLNFKDMIYRTYSLNDINDAFQLYRAPGQVKGKILITNV